MLNKPAWLGDAPVVSDIADTEDCDVLVIGAGNAGTVAALRCQEEGANVFLADMQTYDEYDEYACDMACYNSKLFLDKGTPEIDTTEVFNEYMRLSRGHAHQKIVRDYAMRSGEMLDWMVGHIPPSTWRSMRRPRTTRATTTSTASAAGRGRGRP